MKRVLQLYFLIIFLALAGIAALIFWPAGEDNSLQTQSTSQLATETETEPDTYDYLEESPTLEPEINEDDALDFAEVDPMFPGGEAAMMDFIRDNFRYPEEARELGEQGTVYVQFIVDKNGKVGKVQVVKSVSPSIDKEAIRVIEKMPNWIPGQQNGEAVKVRYTIPISCRIA